MLMSIKRVFRRLTLAEVAAKELADAELELLSAMTHKEFAQGSITYNETRCKRLRSFLATLTPTPGT